MCDTIECLLADILASAGSDAQQLAKRAEKFVEQLDARITELDAELLKKDASLRLKDHEIAEYKRQIDKLRKINSAKARIAIRPNRTKSRKRRVAAARKNNQTRNLVKAWLKIRNGLNR
jgi:peptidoglycan hydrolase CwlO-like protein